MDPEPPGEEEDPDQSEASSEEESGVDQELSKSEAVYHEDGNSSFLSIPSGCNCQGVPGIPQGPYSEGGDGSSSNVCHHCMSPTMGEDEELEKKYDDEEPLKFPSEFSWVSSRKKPPPPFLLTKEDNQRRVDAEIPGPLVNIGWAGNKVRQISAEHCFTLLRDRPQQQLVRIVQWCWLELLWFKQRTNSQGNTPVASGQYCQPEEEVARLLTMAGVLEDELNPFHVVGVEATASDTELKKAYRQLAVMVHPDKNHHPQAEEAFEVLRAAWDIVSNPERLKYEMK
ncbi:DnaJ-like protein subfamily C member 14 [Heterocephalus glaber]|uniref:DnaJ-like protein subfamily C member 14 n=1 Tax=Heterocephalus glaber TaxID=10181 RepID=G5BJP8_HETGA|nr:DnaJ-like protein subfamily C member 14 [Heterocephalus glaber]